MAIQESMRDQPNLIAIGQGLWSPFYVGSTMENLEKIFSKSRVIDSPVSENACTAMSLGIALAGGRALVVHPRMDFLILGTDPIVNAIAKWRSALARDIPIPITIRAIINRGGEQGAQHSQSLYSWFAHVPGLRVVAPSNASDAYRLLRQSLTCDDPVIFIEDRWDYECISKVNLSEELPPLHTEDAKVLRSGSDLTMWGIGHTVNLAMNAANILEREGISCEVIDQRIIAPFNGTVALDSAAKTGRLVTIENSWPVASMTSELLARMARGDYRNKFPLVRSLHMAATTAPTSSALEKQYFVTLNQVVDSAREILKN